MLVDLAGHLGCHHEHPVRGQHQHPVIRLVSALQHNTGEFPWQYVKMYLVVSLLCPSHVSQ